MFQKSNLRYLVEFIIIITGVFLSFYLDDIRQLNEKKDYKDTLIEELIVSSQEDLAQLKNIISDLDVVQVYISQILLDLADKTKNLEDSEIAEKYLFITQKMSVSFFPQNGIFNQLISTGSIELIDNNDLRRTLLSIFTHYYERNSANNRTLDDLYLAFGKDIDPYISVMPVDKNDASFIYGDKDVGSYSIDTDFYLSNKFKAYLLTASSMTDKNIDMLNIFQSNYQKVVELGQEELR